MTCRSKTWSAKRLSYVPLLCAGVVIAGEGIVNDYGLFDGLLTLAGGIVCGWSLAALRN